MQNDLNLIELINLFKRMNFEQQNLILEIAKEFVKKKEIKNDSKINEKI